MISANLGIAGSAGLLQSSEQAMRIVSGLSLGAGTVKDPVS